MKKILFATTALVATAGYASADITVTGGANMGVKYVEDRAAGETFLYNELDFNIVGSGTTDSGIEFGASIDLDASLTDESASQDPGSFDPEAYVSSGGLTLTIGTLDGVSDPFGLPDIGFDGVGVDDVAEDLMGGALGVKSGANVMVSYTFGDYNFAAAHDGDDNWGVSFDGSVNGFTFGIAYEEANDITFDSVTFFGTTFPTETIDVKSTWLNLGYSFDAFTVGAFYVDMDIDMTEIGYFGDPDVDLGSSSEEGYGLSASYTAGDLTVTGVWADSSTADDAAYGIDAAYDLGSGLVLKGGVASVNDGTNADLGVIMSF
ncbi:porin [Pseudooceanicola marinus]|uniref:porin n=1 Tax=Pseudooceanicola marinus TaxID=396013 RepID=UPI001CD681AD|nr:porin [Pseudooceanicola marinus]MCA1336228.1 porin [Pseudooceanicola marinus]